MYTVKLQKQIEEAAGLAAAVGVRDTNSNYEKVANDFVIAATGFDVGTEDFDTARSDFDYMLEQAL
jgi:lysine/ornithine N-monooxygenase